MRFTVSALSDDVVLRHGSLCAVEAADDESGPSRLATLPATRLTPRTAEDRPLEAAVDARQWTLAQQAAFAGTAFLWRSVSQRRRTGSTGLVLHRERGAAATATGVLMAGGAAALVAGTARRGSVPWTVRAALGAAAMLAGTGVTLAAQRAMGTSWRVGVDPQERTELVTTGLFRRVRNPVFSGMLLFAAGNALAVPHRLTGAGLAQLSAGITGQVLLIEEPHLRRQHGRQYADYLASSGRFLPRLRRSASD